MFTCCDQSVSGRVFLAGQQWQTNSEPKVESPPQMNSDLYLEGNSYGSQGLSRLVSHMYTNYARFICPLVNVVTKLYVSSVLLLII